MDSLQQLFDTEFRHLNIGCNDRGKRPYLRYYEKYVGHRREEPLNILELGIDQGAGLLFFRKAFPNATIWGMDIMAKNPLIAAPHGLWHYVNGSAWSKDDAKLFPNGLKFDIIADDANEHHIENQLKTFAIYKNLMAPGGVYFLEDIRTASDNEAVVCALAGDHLKVEFQNTRKLPDIYAWHVDTCEGIAIFSGF